MLNLKILGSGCPNCERLEQTTIETLEMLGVEATIEHIRDHAEYPKYGLLFTPGLVINEQLVSAGRIPSQSEIVTFLTTALAEAGQVA
jgi:small redox-active disulfide protein 2